MKVNIDRLPIGTKFGYKGEGWVVVDDTEYPFIEAKCVTNPDEYEGLNVIFGNFEVVEVADDTVVYEIKFERTTWGGQLTRKLPF